MSEGILNDAWELYVKTVIPVDASPALVRNLRIAFYGGANVILSVINTTEGSPSREEMLANIFREDTQFLEDLMNGRI